MGMWDQVKSQLRSVVEWKDPEATFVFQKWSDAGDEIKNASKLIVGPGQGVIFVYEGKVQAVHVVPGIYELRTANIPFITTITKFMQAFQSEHKVGLYFFRTGVFTDQKWGTQRPIKYDDPKYKFPVALKAFGNFSFTIKDAEHFFSGVVIKADALTTEVVREMVVSRIMTPAQDFLAEKKFSYADIDANLVEIAQGIKALTAVDFATLGFELVDFRISGTTFDDKTMERINKIADMQAEAQAAAAVGLNYAQMQQLGAMRDAAKNEGGGMAATGAQMGLGVVMGQQMAQGMANLSQTTNLQPPEANDPAAKLQKLKILLDSGLITAEDFAKKKADILASM